jgi:undecaprenyl-diphosphatase
MARAFLRGLVSRSAREESDFRFALAVVLGSLPIGIVGLLFEDVVKGPVLRSLTTVGIALILWSGVMVLAERRATQERRGEEAVTVRDALIIGAAQTLALVPGVSRSGATISAGLLLGLDRVTATRLAFLLGIPSLTAAALYQLPSAVSEGVGVGPTLVGTVVSFVVAYAAIAWLLKFVSGHPITWFVPYRVALGVAVLIGVAVTS